MVGEGEGEREEGRGGRKEGRERDTNRQREIDTVNVKEKLTIPFKIPPLQQSCFKLGFSAV